MRRMWGVLVFSWLGQASVAFGIAPGQSMPEFSLPQAKSGVLADKALPGHVTVINLWATWCDACKVELVEMEDAFKPLLNEKGMQVAFVSLDKEQDKAVAWFQSNFKEPAVMLERLYFDSSFALADKLEADSFPMTLIIGKDGKIKYIQRGFKTGEGSTAAMAKVAAELLKQPQI